MKQIPRKNLHLNGKVKPVNIDKNVDAPFFGCGKFKFNRSMIKILFTAQFLPEFLRDVVIGTVYKKHFKKTLKKERSHAVITFRIKQGSNKSANLQFMIKNPADIENIETEAFMSPAFFKTPDEPGIIFKGTAV
jgi:hypothetical protein